MCSALYSFPPYSMGHWSTPCTASILAEPLGTPMGPSVSRASHRVLLSLLVASCSSRTPVRQLLFPRTPIPKDVTAGWTACELGGHNSLCSRDGRGREAGVSLRLDEAQGWLVSGCQCVLRSLGRTPMKMSPVTLGIVVAGLW